MPSVRVTGYVSLLVSIPNNTANTYRTNKRRHNDPDFLFSLQLCRSVVWRKVQRFDGTIARDWSQLGHWE
ncbi:hypothetical protein ACOMHN_013054 [Nucella lapillus]